ncbi:putative RNA polymerase II transcriptional coactivator KELP-like [Capsicum annuum]|uniref:uncharacterized protein LOC107864138 n=1 Tax=Capsicum annuum TaxID=4072 RepID=UPI001FB09EA7|nr:uncharacterized protein LOC107864138 [Capsicum annuum]KAF3663896.1 putative RNA polymerase II transcriptional coactivator KELP-like [Capsicum annuum]KAF3681382.1 putative RNA polymerase II transcriptional coactivator KELP-like [Capsicum annuum]
MGCASSKRIEAAVDVYRPPPTSFAVFDINSIEEPWLKGGNNNKMEEGELDQDEPEENEKPTKVAQPILEKLNSSIDDAPKSWDEVSKALEDLKPTLQNPPPQKSPKKTLLALPALPPPPSVEEEEGGASPKRKIPRKSFSFHTLEELEYKLSSKDSKKPNEVKKKESMMQFTDEENKRFQKFSNKTVKKNESQIVVHNGDVAQSQQGYKPVKENIFLLRDKMEREKEGKVPMFIKFNPLHDYPEKCPPRGDDSLVVYTTSLGGVRRTFEDCNKVRLILESHRVVFDERDVSLHGEFRQELKELLGEGEDASVPRLFVKGRYIGGVEEVVNLNETKRLGRILNYARVERGPGRLGCEGCGGARFVPCFDCGGSCKVVNGDAKERCPQCNENGLIHCPICD